MKFQGIITSILCIGITGCLFIESAFAEDTTSSGSKGSTVIVTEEIPGAGCTCINDTNIVKNDDNGVPNAPAYNCSNPATRKYSCTIKPGFSSFETMLATIIRYVVFISMLLGVLALVIMGILWSIAGADEPKVKALKGWFINILVGLALLFFFRFILVTLAPWIYQ